MDISLWSNPHKQCYRVRKSTYQSNRFHSNFDCTVVSNNHTSITCTTPSGVLFSDQAFYNVNVTIGGQSFYSSQQFSKSFKSWHSRQQLCVTLDARTTEHVKVTSPVIVQELDMKELIVPAYVSFNSWHDILTLSTVVCSPDCVHGVCIRGNDQEKQCSCDSGWTASDCSRTIDGQDYTAGMTWEKFSDNR